ncbi:MAG TPA: hypothetical protein VK603_08040, partial [Candidatus Saccharimonadales bacterium]|nr:hypothetical protein [Candidatus Saccharimonadales bacterium]
AKQANTLVALLTTLVSDNIGRFVMLKKWRVKLFRLADSTDNKTAFPRWADNESSLVTPHRDFFAIMLTETISR